LETTSQVLDAMLISGSKSHLVANTKTLHHILPDLIPPVDRAYTLAFFCINTELPSCKPASAIWQFLFPAFVDAAAQLSTRLTQLVDLHEENWYTSPTKVLDNAIIGAMSG
jgi:hypothetical protein